MKVKSINTEANKPASRNAERVTVTQSKFLVDVRQYGTEQALYDHKRSAEWLNKCLAENPAFKVDYFEAVQLTEKQVKFLQVFVKKMTNVKQTCKAIGIARSTFYKWVDTSDTFKKEVENVREGFYDDVESILYEKIFVQKDTASLIYFTKTKMRHRGYTERQEIDMKTNVSADIHSFNKSARYTPEELEAEIEKYRKLAGRK